MASKNTKQAQGIGCEEHRECGGDGGEDEDLTCKLGIAIHFLRHRHCGNREGRCEEGDENGKMRGFEATEQKRDAKANEGGEEVARANAEQDLLFQGGDGGEFKVGAEAEERHGGGDRGEVGKHLVNRLNIRQSEGDSRLHKDIADTEQEAAGGNAEDQRIFENAEEDALVIRLFAREDREAENRKNIENGNGCRAHDGGVDRAEIAAEGDRDRQTDQGIVGAEDGLEHNAALALFREHAAEGIEEKREEQKVYRYAVNDEGWIDFCSELDLIDVQHQHRGDENAENHLVKL